MKTLYFVLKSFTNTISMLYGDEVEFLEEQKESAWIGVYLTPIQKDELEAIEIFPV